MKNQNALIIGASRGIGLSVVQSFAAQGWQVAATYRSAVPEQGENAQIQWYPLDMTQTNDVKALARQLEGQKFDAILINAGISGPTDLSGEDAEIAQLFLTNSVAPVRSAEIFLPLLNKNGVIAFTSSILGSLNENSAASMPVYSASKAALNMLSRSLADAVNQQGGTLLSLHPGWVQTDMGGSSAPVTVEQSGAGLVKQLTDYQGRGGHHYVDYTGHELQW